MYIRVRVTAGARKESVIEVDSKRLEIAVKEKAKDNAANRRVVELVARHYRVPVKSVRITRGHTSPAKLLTILE
ncbi:hypothetical protein A3H77_00130 [Candidatus Kaiserbacteria bacterium RIFCSPLOWO2_02_FULL_56_11]|uniref:Uncharacterized protein n=2 Tax=Candidatus Kaiseribacteriota TaxID=1752734 RepID=A0A1F6E504_9BACT|nr:MAG: hypothetical protein A3C95_01950 [Candidatus Kaiserbacteria bacterium RIFCSPHIGHO2_02_FULL_56_30]OGG72196.1 MAG: hypothetical protein A3E65_00325 [Candidatus Kaiserbacteria bacterium RIFCSPHIGHO2_12_FULL_56_13]OGG81090.1 MAG: hypothetical protein A3H77_00130 [Candidatus Kaiserbacteria bacterium RIFCSPLOWO2_02_FULL_56_11]